MERCEVLIVGGGVLGLACAAHLARAGRDVVLIERHAQLGTETSSRNSEVVHAGLYYPTGSLKAHCCVRGRALLYQRCREHDIPHRQTGKLVVATSDAQLSELEDLRNRGIDNGAGDLQLLDSKQLSRMEPRVRAEGALLSPETGIVDSHALIQSYRSEAIEHGALIITHTTLVGLDCDHGSWCARTRDAKAESFDLQAGWLINSGGLAAQHIASLAGLDCDALDLTLHPCKGDYFSLSGRLRGAVERLIYPMPEAAGLGIHLTLDLEGQLRAGPDTEYVEETRYDVDPAKAQRFAAALQRYFPEVTPGDLSPGYAGIRPKLQAPGAPARDFVIHLQAAPAQAVHLFGIESPGLTAAAALAEEVGRVLQERS